MSTDTKVIRMGVAWACANISTNSVQQLNICNRKEKLFNACGSVFSNFDIKWVHVDQNIPNAFESTAINSTHWLMENGHIDTYNDLFHITYKRLQLYKFSDPIAYNQIMIYVRRMAYEPIPLFGFILQPFTSQVWILLAITCLTVLLLIGLFVKLLLFQSNFDPYPICPYPRANENGSYDENKNNQHKPTPRRSNSVWLIVTVWLVMAALFEAIYAAQLISNATAAESMYLPKTPQALAEMIRSRRVTLIASNPQKSTFVKLKNSTEPNAVLLQEALSYNPMGNVSSVAEACRLVAGLGNQGAEKRYVYIDDSLSVIENPECAKLLGCRRMTGIAFQGLDETAWTAALLPNRFTNKSKMLLDKFNRCALARLASASYSRLSRLATNCFNITAYGMNERRVALNMRQMKDAVYLLVFLHTFCFLYFLIEVFYKSVIERVGFLRWMNSDGK